MLGQMLWPLNLGHQPLCGVKKGKANWRLLAGVTFPRFWTESWHGDQCGGSLSIKDIKENVLIAQYICPG